MNNRAQAYAAGSLEPLVFDGPLLIVGGGHVETDMLFELAKKAHGLIGADHGADIIADAGLVPDAVIGDMDSVDKPSRFGPETRVVKLADQDSTDFEKCLALTKAPITLALGMTGGRFDHTLAALHAVAVNAAERRIILIDEHDLALGVAGSIRLSAEAGMRVSVYPLGRTMFDHSEGLAYPLDGLDMAQGQKIGTSNAATGGMVQIEAAPSQDPWLLILDRGRLDIVLDALGGA